MSGQYEHQILGTEEVLERLADELKALGYEIPEAPELRFSCEEDGCTGCDEHLELIVLGSLNRAFAEGGRDDIYEACDRLGAVYAGGGTWLL